MDSNKISVPMPESLPEPMRSFVRTVAERHEKEVAELRRKLTRAEANTRMEQSLMRTWRMNAMAAYRRIAGLEVELDSTRGSLHEAQREANDLRGQLAATQMVSVGDIGGLRAANRVATQ